ncbi:hypothetical protein AC249_AIPGENE20160 [Exaiptasia diaphana]|nr:hypothetical protein AC249_AIPGENE20160 [Exaiptasia diaphana]
MELTINSIFPALRLEYDKPKDQHNTRSHATSRSVSYIPRQCTKQAEQYYHNFLNLEYHDGNIYIKHALGSKPGTGYMSLKDNLRNERVLSK